MAETRPPTPNELRWAMRKINNLLKTVDELNERIRVLEQAKSITNGETNE